MHSAHVEMLLQNDILFELCCDLLDILLEDILEHLCALFGVALAVVLVVDVDATESCLYRANVSISTFITKSHS